MRELPSMILALALGCLAEPTVGGDPLRVLAAASLTDALPPVVASWGRPAEISFDASSRLARQIDAGAPAHLFLAADREWVDWLAARGRVSRAEDLLGNRLVVVVPVGAAPSEDPLGDAVHLALAGEDVPAGRYARQALGAQGRWEELAPRVVSGDHVRATLAWVAAGHAEAGIVYATDAATEPGVRVAQTLPEELTGPIVVRAAVLEGAPPAADALLEHLREADDAFRAAGFVVP